MCKELCRDICQTLSKLVGYVLILVTIIMMIFGIAGSALAGGYLFTDLDLDIGAIALPEFMFPFVFGFSLFILIVNFCGCVGFTMAMRKADQKLNGIMEDGDNESSGCRCGMKIWMGSMLVFGLLHICVGITSMVYGGDLDLSDYQSDANGVVTSATSDLSCNVEKQINDMYGPDFNSTEWIDLQRYFECCGYSMYDTRTWTGACCPTDVEPAQATTESLETNVTETDNVVSEPYCAGEDFGSTPYTGSDDMATVMSSCGNESTCSARLAYLFSAMGLFMLILGFFEWFCVALGCCLSCCSKTQSDKDGRPQP